MDIFTELACWCLFVHLTLVHSQTVLREVIGSSALMEHNDDAFERWCSQSTVGKLNKVWNWYPYVRYQPIKMFLFVSARDLLRVNCYQDK